MNDSELDKFMMSDPEHDHNKCLTGCAHTYREAREAQKEKEKTRTNNSQADETKRNKSPNYI